MKLAPQPIAAVAVWVSCLAGCTAKPPAVPCVHEQWIELREDYGGTVIRTFASARGGCRVDISGGTYGPDPPIAVEHAVCLPCDGERIANTVQILSAIRPIYVERAKALERELWRLPSPSMADAWKLDSCGRELSENEKPRGRITLRFSTGLQTFTWGVSISSPLWRGIISEFEAASNKVLAEAIVSRWSAEDLIVKGRLASAYNEYDSAWEGLHKWAGDMVTERGGIYEPQVSHVLPSSYANLEQDRNKAMKVFRETWSFLAECEVRLDRKDNMTVVTFPDESSFWLGRIKREDEANWKEVLEYLRTRRPWVQ